MDRHVWWLRRTVVRGAAVRCLAVGAGASLLAYALVREVALALVLGQIGALAWFAMAMAINPLSHRYLREHLASPLWFEPSAPEDGGHDIANAAVALGMRHIVTARATALGGDDPDAEPPDDADAFAYDLLQTKDGLVTAAVNRANGTFSVMSKLSDDRIVHTASMLVPPSHKLVVNTVDATAVRDIVRSHAGVLGELVDRGVRPVAATPRIWLDVMGAEHHAYEELGPIVGSLFALQQGPSYGRLLVPVDPRDVLALSVGPRLPERPTRGVATLRRADAGLPAPQAAR